MSEPIKHECGIALVRLRKPLQYYIDTYGSDYAARKTYLLMQKQHNRGQDGAGIANIKLDLPAGNRYISRFRSVESQPLEDIFAKVSERFQAAKDADPELYQNAEWLKENHAFTGELWLGHLRYGTFGKNRIENCHPFLRQNNWRSRNLVMAGNFNMTNVDELFQILLELGSTPKRKLIQ